MMVSPPKHTYIKMLYVKCFSVVIILEVNAQISGIVNSFNTRKKEKAQKKEWLYKDYMKKFDLMEVYQNIEDEYKKIGKPFIIGDEFDTIMERIDETDELLSLKFGKGDPKFTLEKNSRRAFPGFYQHGVFRPTNENEMERDTYLWDPHYVRYRLNELMKQLIYTTRNKMVPFQTLREIYRNQSLYKMGFLMSKTDEAVKNYIRFAFRSYKGCTGRVTRGSTWRRTHLDIMTTKERLLFKWFHIDLLSDLVIQNDENAREIMTNVSFGRKTAWKFFD